ncbi:hypothetical protein Bca52824_024917 [Brassica carinata]|uniref:Uncharacterized protein n=1 Tax=Brassica carinata TaxID=52824 RepID=A0A8X8AV67_BRACI|nr:hypothetical protein Bca52824_024917 [Brassica carinata]
MCMDGNMGPTGFMRPIKLMDGDHVARASAYKWKDPKKVKYKEVNTSEVEAAATGKGSSEEEDREDLEGNVILFTLLSAMESMSIKFDHIDSQFNAYELDRNRPLVDQKTIDDMAKASLEERLKVLGVGKSSKKNDKLSIVGEEQSLSLPSPQHKTLVEEFGSGAATPAKAPELDFVYVSPAKATKPTKPTKDDKDAQDAKGEAYGRGWRGKRIVKDELFNEVSEQCQCDTKLCKRENLPVLYPGPGDLLDRTTPTWFRFLSDLSLVIPSILAEEKAHDWPTYRVIPDHFKECWFLQLAVAVSISDAKVEEEMGAWRRQAFVDAN